MSTCLPTVCMPPACLPTTCMLTVCLHAWKCLHACLLHYCLRSCWNACMPAWQCLHACTCMLSWECLIACMKVPTCLTHVHACLGEHACLYGITSMPAAACHFHKLCNFLHPKLYLLKYYLITLLVRRSGFLQMISDFMPSCGFVFPRTYSVFTDDIYS
jgi:hypothetical protein